MKNIHLIYFFLFESFWNDPRDPSVRFLNIPILIDLSTPQIVA
jgi:hypothetical protein